MTDQEQSLVSHLVELRSRLIKAVMTMLILIVVMFPFAGEIYTLIASPVINNLAQGTEMIATGVLSPFLTPFKMVIILAVIISMPMIIYQMWAFVAPGLYKSEKRVATPILISSIVLFYMGCAFAYFVVFPIIFVFLPGIAPEGVAYMPDINSYLDIVVRLFFAFGLAFEIPVAVIILIMLGVTSAEKLAKSRPYVIVGIFVVAMLLTPPDPSTQILLAIPMWLLFEFGLLMGQALKKKSQKANQ
ncbi:twin-arginine translocase subunit TatC [Marinicella sediminis]|uniref:Sec-independent protein translocase protein TatC n=1 Tax=Marinicella sediminis TaxID=1792834 RepID=A0ABV7J8A5_9GAMM|nr:twin-arginine translocase subunit TatC [Marinicella sediminis]